MKIEIDDGVTIDPERTMLISQLEMEAANVDDHGGSLYGVIHQGLVNTDRFRLMLMDRRSSHRLAVLHRDIGLQEVKAYRAGPLGSGDPLDAFFVAVAAYKDSLQSSSRSR